MKSTPNASSVVLSSARVAGVDRADARASSVAREPPRFFGETAALRVAGFLAAGLAAGFFAGDFFTAGFLAGAGDAARRLTAVEALAVCARVRRVAGMFVLRARAY